MFTPNPRPGSPRAAVPFWSGRQEQRSSSVAKLSRQGSWGWGVQPQPGPQAYQVTFLLPGTGDQTKSMIDLLFKFLLLSVTDTSYLGSQGQF